MDLLIMNPGRSSRPVRRRRKNPARKTRVLGVSKKGNKVKVTVLRRKRLNPMTAAARKRAGKKAARTRASKKVARSKAGKKAAATHKRNARKNPTSRKQAKNVSSMFGTKTAKRPKARKGSKRKCKGKGYTKAGAARKARAARKVAGKHMRSANAVLKRSKNKQARGVAKSYKRARSTAFRASKGRLNKEAARYAKDYGLLRINPSMKAVFEAIKGLLPIMLAGAATFVGATTIGAKLSGWAAAKMPAKTPALLVQNIVPIATGVTTVVAFWALKTSKKMQKWAMPVFLGGGIATVMQLLSSTVIGQKVAAKLGFLTTATLGAYVNVPGYLGAYGTELPPGASFYGRSDLGDYIDAGPQEAFGAYYESDYPVHSPGPGDNEYNMATLGEFELEQTPGGTVLSGGMFDGPSAI